MKEKISKKVHIYMFVTLIIALIEIAVLLSFAFHPMSFKNTITSGMYTGAANWEIENSKLVKDTADFCRPFGVNKNVIECVVNNVGNYYNYTTREEEYPVILKTDDIKENGYLCRDVAVAYNAIFRDLGFYVDYVFTKEHVYNVVYSINDGEYLDCTVNMDRYHCW